MLFLQHLKVSHSKAFQLDAFFLLVKRNAAHVFCGAQR